MPRLFNSISAEAYSRALTIAIPSYGYHFANRLTLRFDLHVCKTAQTAYYDDGMVQSEAQARDSSLQSL
jgi:hypothetical protein